MIQTLLSATAVLLLLPAIGVNAAGNAVTIPLATEDRSEIEHSFGGGVLGEALPAAAITDPNLYLDMSVRSRTYRLRDESGAESDQIFRLMPVGPERTTQIWRYQEGDVESGEIERQADGSFVLTGVEDVETGAATRYAPAEPFLLKGMMPGGERRLRMAVRVYDPAQPSEVTHEGSLDVVHRYLGAYRIRVPAGTYDAVLMKSSFNGRIGPARLEDTQYRFFAPGAGLVASIERRDVSALLLYRAHLQEAKLLAPD